MRGWKDLEVVETIYEEEDHEEVEEEYSSSSSSSTTSTSSSLLLTPSTHLPSSLDNTVQAWSLATGFQTDVLIKVQDQSFHLHKDPLVSKSEYLKRELKESSVINLTPTLNITAETFSTVADFCYSSYVVITPFNVAALRVAAELLDMNEDNNNGEENLKYITESYFSKAVTVNKDYAVIILRSCLGLLPEAEETALLASRCIESLDLMDGNNGMDEVSSLKVEDFELIADSMHYLLTRSHDLLYRIVDSYFKENSEKLKEEEKTSICSSIDCYKLSSNIIVHAVQNPQMPLRFIIRAMLVEQFNTRDSICTTLSMKNNNQQQKKYKKQPKTFKENNEIIEDSEVLSLGMILQRDAALRQSAQLKASVESTSSKIERLEREIISMKKVLYDHDVEKKKREIGNEIGSGRSVSLRFNNTSSSENKIERGERGSTSLVNFRFSNIGVSSRGERNGGGNGSSSTNSSSVSTPSLERLSSLNDNPKRRTTFGWKLMNGLKSAFRMSSTKGVPHDMNENGTTVEVSNDIVLNGGNHDHEDGDQGNGDASVTKRSRRHCRSRSLL